MTTQPPATPAPQATKTEEKAVTKPSPIATLRDLLEKNKTSIAMALPKHLTADRMLRIAMTAAQKTPKLLDCDQRSFLGAIVQCAQLGLEPNDGTGKAWLIPFRNTKKNRLEVQFIPGYRGLVTLARNTGEVKRFDATAVYANDTFYYERGTEPKIKHIPWDMRQDKKFAEPGALTHVYAIAGFKDGAIQFDVMGKAEVDAIRKRSKSGGDGPWVTDYSEMAKKSVVRRISKMLPASSEKDNAFHKAVALDERAELGLPQDLGTIVDAEEVGTEDNGKDPTQAPMPQSTDGKPAPGTEAVAEQPKTTTQPVAPEPAAEKKVDPPGEKKPVKTVAFEVDSVAKTTLGETEVVVVKTREGEKLYCDNPDSIIYYQSMSKAGAKLEADVESLGGKKWITKARPVPKA